MKFLLLAAAVLLILDFCGFGKGNFAKISGILAICAIFVFTLSILGIILDALVKIILVLLGIYVVMRLIIAIKDLFTK